AAGNLDVAMTPAGCRPRRARVARKLREVSVVAGRLDRAAESGVDEPTRAIRGNEGHPQHAREERRDDDGLGAARIHPRELAVGTEAAEDAVPALEQAADGVELGRRRAGHDDLDAHGAKRALRRRWTAHSAGTRSRARASPGRSRTRARRSSARRPPSSQPTTTRPRTTTMSCR